MKRFSLDIARKLPEIVHCLVLIYRPAFQCLEDKFLNWQLRFSTMNYKEPVKTFVCSIFFSPVRKWKYLITVIKIYQSYIVLRLLLLIQFCEQNVSHSKLKKYWQSTPQPKYSNNGTQYCVCYICFYSSYVLSW